MDLLILGGTMFLGRHIVDQALRAGHRVTTFTRGRTNPDLFPNAERLHGNRDGDIGSLRGRRWDAVIDTSGYVPRVVRQSVEAIDTGHYTFVSSISVYADGQASLDESATVATIADPTVEEITGESYGALKALCEQEVTGRFGDSALIVRPGLIVGPWDPSDRFTYWPRRVARGGEILAPKGPDKPTQWIDVRDLASWTLSAVERKLSGTFNASGRTVPFGELLDACVSASGADARITWVDEAFLLENEVGPWMELTLWIPGDDAMMRMPTTKVDQAGMTYRPGAETVADTLAWDRAQPERPPRAGLDAEKEAKVLAAWRAR
ncbi:MAG: NAD-dependent epimerase/dehydratase family protein [Actinomycetota bacterium]|nr:NAD-dependent epimerase/dehydratase family protein [Actinomycetota bacterium]